MNSLFYPIGKKRLIYCPNQKESRTITEGRRWGKWQRIQYLLHRLQQPLFIHFFLSLVSAIVNTSHSSFSSISFFPPVDPFGKKDILSANILFFFGFPLWQDHSWLELRKMKKDAVYGNRFLLNKFNSSLLSDYC